MYEIDDQHRTIKLEDDGTRNMLANFSARITRETKYNDGQTTKTILTVEGQSATEKYPPVDIEADKYATLNWVMPNWGVAAVIQPGNNVKDNLRTAIQLNSKPRRETVYTHTGWTRKGSEYMYLHQGGAITAKGPNNSQRVELPTELRGFNITNGTPEKDAIAATLGFLNIAPLEIVVPILAATFAPLTTQTDFAVHVTGKTGTFKSELASLAQSHYGEDMDARHLPGSWSSTPNALEAQTYRAKNALFTIDDFIPAGTSWQQRSYQKTADQIIRGQGNQAGRARLTDMSSLQTTMYPRGLILSTGEDTPEGHSVRGRMLILELSPQDVNIPALTHVQNNRHKLPSTTAAYIQYVAQAFTHTHQKQKQLAKTVRDENIEVGHARTPSTIGTLIATWRHLLEWMQLTGAITTNIADDVVTKGEEAIKTAGDKQEQYLTAADPCEAFTESIRHILAAHIGHLRTINGGIPALAENFGWTAEASLGDLPMYKSHGKCLGWMDWNTDELLIDVTAAYNDIKKHANNQITFTKQTMLKRLKDSGLLTRTDDTRQRNTIRVTCEQHPRTVIAMPLSQTLNITEKP